MEQDNTAETSGEGGFTPAPLGDILRGGSAPTPREPAGRQATEAPSEGAAETGDKSVDLTKAPVTRDESGRFASKSDQQEAGPPPDKQDAPQTAPIAAVLEERKKRQALEARLKEMEARLAAPQAPTPAAAPATPEVPLEDLMFQDPQRFIQAVRAPLEDQLVQTRLAMSEANARREPDFEETTSAFHQYVEANPHLKDSVRQALRSHPDPARWAVEQGRALLAEQRWGSVVSQYGTPEAFLAAQQQQQATAPVAASVPATPPGSLASVRSAGPRGVPQWNGPTPLSKIFGGRR
jgi:hypothetical protein